MSVEEPNCYTRTCVHFIGVSSDENEKDQECTCKAFPDGIPVEIAFGDNPHLTPFPGDNGIQYDEDRSARFVFNDDDMQHILKGI